MVTNSRLPTFPSTPSWRVYPWRDHWVDLFADSRDGLPYSEPRRSSVSSQPDSGSTLKPGRSPCRSLRPPSKPCPARPASSGRSRRTGRPPRLRRSLLRRNEIDDDEMLLISAVRFHPCKTGPRTASTPAESNHKGIEDTTENAMPKPENLDQGLHLFIGSGALPR